jgi:hypothetical protein
MMDHLLCVRKFTITWKMGGELRRLREAGRIFVLPGTAEVVWRWNNKEQRILDYASEY